MADHPPIALRISLPDEAIDPSNLALNHELNRNTLRAAVIGEFLKEEPGTGNGALTSRYRYDVESIDGEGGIYLLRPAQLNKGFDFVVHVEEATFGNGKTNPRHLDVFDDLKTKVEFLESLGSEGVNLRNDIHRMVSSVYYGVEPDLIIENFELSEDVTSLPGISLELILKVLKWLFIEQDICYWNWSGRTMLMSRIDDILAPTENAL